MVGDLDGAKVDSVGVKEGLFVDIVGEMVESVGGIVKVEGAQVSPGFVGEREGEGVISLGPKVGKSVGSEGDKVGNTVPSVGE